MGEWDRIGYQTKKKKKIDIFGKRLNIATSMVFLKQRRFISRLVISVIQADRSISIVNYQLVWVPVVRWVIKCTTTECWEERGKEGFTYVVEYSRPLGLSFSAGSAVLVDC